MTDGWLDKFGTEFDYGVVYDFLSSAEDRGIKQAGAAHGLNAQESLAIYAYTLGLRGGSSPFKVVNGFLRTGSPGGAFVEALIADLRSALPKLPRYKGIVYRKVSLPSDVRALVVAGTTYRDSAFLSTSTDPNVFDGDDMMLISASSGVSISHLSAFPHEDEVLFLPGTAFLIGSVEPIDQGLFMELVEQEHG